MILSKIISLFLSFCLILEQGVFAQTIDLSHYFSNSSKAILQGDKFRPLHLRYVSYDAETDDFQILLDKGDFFNQKTEKTLELEKTSQELMNYFFIGLALPNEKFWVNLRPDSPDNILDPLLEKTDIGRIFLEADLQLKKDTSGMTSPQTLEGKAYWDKLYKKAGELFDSQNITIPTITRPWIVPAETIIGESPDGAYIYKARLKVMLEEDYLNEKTEELKNKRTEDFNFSDQRLKELNEYSTQLINAAIIPKLTYAVNTSKRYAPLRQVYYSLILAQWFKQKYSSAGSTRASGTGAPVNSYINLIDSGNLANLTSKEPYDKQTYFQQYQKSFKDGEYNLQEPVYTPTGQSIRRYISGGVLVEKIIDSTVTHTNKNSPTRDYLISPTLSSPINIEKIAQELSEVLFDPDKENKHLFVWKEEGKGKITPEIFKKIIENINDERARNQEFANAISEDEILKTLVIRIITDTLKMESDDPAKSQKQLFKDVVYDYTIRPDQWKKHINEYIAKFSRLIPKMYSLTTNMKNSLQEIPNFNAISPVFNACARLFHYKNDIDFFLEWERQLGEGEKRFFLALRNTPDGILKFFPAQGTDVLLRENFNIKIQPPRNRNNLKYFRKENVIYLRNIHTRSDIWITFYGLPGEEINQCFIAWANNNKIVGKDIPLPANRIIDLNRLTDYEGVKRLLASSSAAAQTDKDPDIQNLSEFVNGLIKWEDWNVFYKKAAKNTEKTQKETPIKINGHDYYVRSNLSPPIAEYLKGVVIITSGLTGKKFVLKRLSHTLEAEIHKELSAKGMSVPGVLSLTDELDKKYLLMDYIEGVEIYKGFYNSDGPYNKLKFLFEIFSKKGALDSFVKDIKIMNDYGISHNDLDNFRNMFFVKDRIVFIDFGLAEKNIKNPDNARPLINSLEALIQEAKKGLKNTATVSRYIAFAETLIKRLRSSPAFNSPDSEKGGIDFSRPEIISRPTGELTSLADSPLAVNPNLDFEEEWRGIQMVFNSGFRPSARRLTEFAASAAESPGNSQRLEDVRGLVSDLLRRDEEEKGADPAEPELKRLLSDSY